MITMIASRKGNTKTLFCANVEYESDIAFRIESMRTYARIEKINDMIVTIQHVDGRVRTINV